MGLTLVGAMNWRWSVQVSDARRCDELALVGASL
jgi:hypothetical protein